MIHLKNLKNLKTKKLYHIIVVSVENKRTFTSKTPQAQSWNIAKNRTNKEAPKRARSWKNQRGKWKVPVIKQKKRNHPNQDKTTTTSNNTEIKILKNENHLLRPQIRLLIRSQYMSVSNLKPNWKTLILINKDTRVWNLNLLLFFNII